MSYSSPSAVEPHPCNASQSKDSNNIRHPPKLVKVETRPGNKQSAATDETVQVWLDAQSDMISGTSLGLVIDPLSRPGQIYPLACWPQQSIDVPECMLNAALQALSEQTVVIVAVDNSETEADKCIVASPLNTGESTGPVAVFELPNSIRQQQQAVIQLMHWGAVWFGLLQRKNNTDTPNSRLVSVVNLLANSLEHTQFNAAATAAATQLATQLECTRVSLGMKTKEAVSISAISNSTRLDARMNLTRDVSAAMNEAVDQEATLVYPTREEGPPFVTHAQSLLAQHKGGKAVMSTPLYDGSNIVGALTLEREFGFDQDSITICESLAVLLGPVIALKHDKERPVLYKLWDSIRASVNPLFGPGQVTYKLYGCMALALIAFMVVATTDYRVNTNARLEGSVKRIITAPIDGFIASADYRAGDTVQAGVVLATLDDGELRLKHLQLSNQREQLEKEHRAALTQHDRSTTAIVSARQQQTNAQLALVEEQLLRTRLIAPFAGIVVSGDLSQSIGTPVENGNILFEIAPLNDYRVILEVDERDIGDVKSTQKGSLTLTGLPDEIFTFSVVRIVPLSKPRDGRNIFEVQAKLDAPSTIIRPGMEGIAKIDIDQRKLLWVWTHELTDWLRLRIWTWVT